MCLTLRRPSSREEVKAAAPLYVAVVYHTGIAADEHAALGFLGLSASGTHTHNLQTTLPLMVSLHGQLH